MHRTRRKQIALNTDGIGNGRHHDPHTHSDTHSDERRKRNTSLNSGRGLTSWCRVNSSSSVQLQPWVNRVMCFVVVWFSVRKEIKTTTATHPRSWNSCACIFMPEMLQHCRAVRPTQRHAFASRHRHMRHKAVLLWLGTAYSTITRHRLLHFFPVQKIDFWLMSLQHRRKTRRQAGRVRENKKEVSRK